MHTSAFPIILTINVTADDIKEGKRGNCKACPIARAALRALKDANVDIDYVKVAWDGIGLYNNGIPLRQAKYRIPSKAIDFIPNFDSGDQLVLPFEFEATLWR